MKVLNSKLKTLCFYLSLVTIIFFFPIIFLVFKFISIFLKIRITEILSNRYGHLALCPEYYLVNKRDGKIKEKFLDFFCESKYGVCNTELFKLWKEKIIILPRCILGPIIFLFDKIYSRSKNPYTINNFNQTAQNLKFIWDKYEPSIKLSFDQIKKCKSILLNNGIDIDREKFVCLFNRDDVYLSSLPRKKNWYYLSHHNYNIDKFNLLAKELSERNIYLFRMGVKAKGTFGITNPKIIDYANSNFRCELLDIFLAARCYFGISCGTGSSGVAYLYRKPMLDLNANLHHLTTWVHTGVMLAKHYYSKDKNRNLTLEELMKFNFGDLDQRQQLDNYNIEMIDCTDKEIKDACIELLYRIEGVWKDTNDDMELQSLFRKKFDVFKKHKKTNLRWHGNVIRSFYSSDFLRNNKSWLN